MESGEARRTTCLFGKSPDVQPNTGFPEVGKG